MANMQQRILLLLLSAVVTSSCASVSVKGVIRTIDDRPIANASVRLQPRDPAGRSFAGSSEPNGCFDLYETIGRDQRGWVMVVEVPGYKPVSIDVAVRKENLLLVAMAPSAAIEASIARPISPSERYVVYASPCEPEVRASSLGLH
jgi:hypothetical protein